jgi:hypothetical protein
MAAAVFLCERDRWIYAFGGAERGDRSGLATVALIGHALDEAARAGAIPATDVLLATDFLDACPCLRIPSTNSAIAPILDRLGAGRWDGACREVRDWYCQHASPQAVAERAARTLGLASPDNMHASRR